MDTPDWLQNLLIIGAAVAFLAAFFVMVDTFDPPK